MAKSHRAGNPACSTRKKAAAAALRCDLAKNNLKTLKELEEKCCEITNDNENYKNKINILNIDVINYLHKIENKNSIIGNLELSNIKLNKNIKELSDKINDIIFKVKKLHKNSNF